MEEKEIKRREQEALKSIKASFGTPEQEYGVTMFAEHHIEEVEPEYWEKHLGTSKPEPKSVLDILILREHWDEDTIFDFTLPDETTDYVISVHFDAEGKVEEITMES